MGYKMNVVELARKSGGVDFTNFIAGGVTTWLGTGTPEFLNLFAENVRAETKEECAKKVEQFRTKMDAGIEHIAEAIRSL